MNLNSDDGNVILEFIGVVVALVVPLTFIAGACISVSQTYLATDAAARAASRAFVSASTDSRAQANARSAARIIMQDHGVLDTTLSTTISCSKTPCLLPSSYVTVVVKRNVKISLPSIFGNRYVTVKASHTGVVDELR